MLGTRCSLLQAVKTECGKRASSDLRVLACLLPEQDCGSIVQELFDQKPSVAS